MSELSPDHVFYIIKEDELRNLRAGKLYFHGDKRIRQDLDNPSKDEYEYFTEFDLATDPYAAFLSAAYKVKKTYISPYAIRFYL